MRRLLTLMLVTLYGATAQPSQLDLLECHVIADVKTDHSITGNMSFIFAATVDSIRSWTFSASNKMTIESVVGRRQNDYALSTTALPGNDSAYTLSFAVPKQRGDSLFITIDFQWKDDGSSSGIFLENGEFAFPYTRNKSWLPYVGNLTSRRATMELTIDSSLIPVSGRPFSWTVQNNERKVLFWNYVDPINIADAFTLCGMNSVRSQQYCNDDSTRSIVLYYSPGRFDSTLADTLIHRLSEAAEFFSSVVGRPEKPLTAAFIFVGSDTVDEQCLNSGSIFIEHNSPRYSAYDSTIVVRSIHAPLIDHLARLFCPVTNDSTALFDYGFSGYLATRFIIAQHPGPSADERERIDLTIHSLNFFPSNPVAAGITRVPNEREILSYKGRYIFMMLDYILGRQSFDSVTARMFRMYRETPITIKKFELLCEQEYGSSLQWFFQEWFYRSTAPEYAMKWASRETTRGSNLVTVSIEQRGDLFSMPVELVFSFGERTIVKRLIADQSRQEFSYLFPATPTDVQIDPGNKVLRWLITTRILAHARSSQLFRAYNKDLVSSQREAETALQLDPSNNTGTAPIADFSLAKIAVIQNDMDKAKEYFLRAIQASTTDEFRLYSLLSLVRYGNVLEMEGKRDEAVSLYTRALDEGSKHPVIYAPAIIEAKKYEERPFITSDEVWYGLY